MRIAMGCCVTVGLGIAMHSNGEHTFSEEQQEMYVDMSSAALEFSEAWPMAGRVVRRSEQYSPRRRSRSAKQRVTLLEKEEWL